MGWIVFQPDQRLLLTDALRPPNGYAFDRAVATTFTLDLTAALVAPVSLGAQRWGDRADPITMMESIRSVADRIDVFCQVGMIKIPAAATDLVAFLEPMVHEVRLHRANDLFHPKIWLIRFMPNESNEPVKMRLLCSSRNLTHDRSWDLIVMLDGEVVLDEPETRDEPLARLIRSLPNSALRALDSERRTAIEQLAHDALHTVWDTPPDVEELWFHTWGLGDSTADLNGSHHFVISAFVNDAGLSAIAGDGSELTLLSRPDELARLSPSWQERAAMFTLDPGVGLDDDTEHIDTALDGLHAKAIIVDHHRAFVGSMNATGQALRGNVEFAVELVTKQRRLSPTKLLDPDDGLGHLVQEYASSADAPPEPEDWSLENDLRRVAGLGFTVRAAAEGERFRLDISSDAPVELSDDTDAWVALHSAPGHRRPLVAEPDMARFERIELADVSPFVFVTLERNGEVRSTVVRGRLVGDPEGRLDAVIARQIDTPEKLMRFMMLVLQLASDGRSDIELGSDEGAEGWWGRTGAGGLVESIAVALADTPDALDDIDRLIDRLASSPEGRQILPDHLEELWAHVRDARRELAR